MKKIVFSIFLLSCVVQSQEFEVVTYKQISSRLNAKDISARQKFTKILLPNGMVVEEGASIEIDKPQIHIINTFNKDTTYQYARVIKGVPIKTIGGWSKIDSEPANGDSQNLKGIIKAIHSRKNRKNGVFEVYVTMKLTKEIDDYSRHSADLEAFIEGEVKVIEEEVKF